MDAGHSRNLADDLIDGLTAVDCVDANRRQPASARARVAGWSDGRHLRAPPSAHLLAELDAWFCRNPCGADLYGAHLPVVTSRVHVSAEYRRIDEQSGVAGNCA